MARSKATSPLVHRHKLAARILLYGSAVLVLAATVAVVRFPRDIGIDPWWTRVDWSQDESVRLLQEYIQIDSSAPGGSEVAAAEFLARQLAEVGVEAHVEVLGKRNANLWAILEGDDRRALVLHNHLDVSAIDNPEAWGYPPFSGTIDPPFLYGRGAFDMKSLTIAQLLAIKALRRQAVPLRRSLVFLATGDEETGSRLGTRWILRQHPELVERFDAVLTEGGAVEATTDQDVKYWGTETLQKRFIDVVVCDGDAGRLADLREILVHPDRQGWFQLDEASERFFRAYADSRTHLDFQDLLRRPDRLLNVVDSSFLLPRNVRSMLRDEIVASPVLADPEGGYRLIAILHLLPWVSFADGWDELGANIFEGYSFVRDVPEDSAGLNPVDHPIFQEIDAYMKRTLPGVTHGPLFVPWSATDARFFRARGIPAYGYSPFLLVSANTARIDGDNERIPLPSLVDGVERYTGLVAVLVGRK